MLREDLEKREAKQLSPYATLAKGDGNRALAEEPDLYRTCFQRDRDRILHCKSFRRLTHKTQVFLSPEGDHYTTRLTHSLEVAQIARTIARALELNEDLTEAIALGHDLGHTPFGHAGERILAKVTQSAFYHEEQSIRVVTKLERNGRGLNLTNEVLDGIRNHSMTQMPYTPEGKIVRYSDKIAYLNHDADDAVRAGVLRSNELPMDVLSELGRTKSQRISTLVGSIVENGAENIRMTLSIEKVFMEFRAFMFEEIYTNPIVKGEEAKAELLLESMFNYYRKWPDRLPEEFKEAREENLERAICDFISGMSDRYATALYEELFIPKSWQLHMES